MRKPIVAANWKMHKAVGEAIDLAAEVKRALADLEAVEVVLCPPFTALKSVGDLVRFGRLELGAQDVHWQPDGAFTGEISVRMLRDLACGYCIVGHSERRTHFGETDDTVNRKARALLEGGVHPIVCVGETLEQRDGGRAEQVIREQIEGSLRDLGTDLGRIVIAYEPVWAIGTGRTASPQEAQSAQRFIRGLLAKMAGEDLARAVRIQYGGSVKPDNAAEIFAQPDVDGGLIGGASLDAESFAAIVRAATPQEESGSP